MPESDTKPKPKRRSRARKEVRPLTIEEGTGVKGAVTRLTPTGVETLELLAGLGLQKHSIAARLGIGCHKVLDACMAAQPEAALAFARGRAGLEGELVGSLAEQARGGYAPAAMFLLKTVFGYREQGPTDGGADPRVAIQINLPSPKSVEDYMRVISGGEAPSSG